MNITNYLERIKLSRVPSVSEDGLYQLQSSQLQHIPFENIDCLMDRKIHTDLENLEKKIMTNHRGGYCFELNGLFSLALEKLKFNQRPLLARSMWRGTGVNSRTHIILLVEIENKKYIADVGFGGPATYHPIPFEIDRADIQPNGTFRITRDETHQYLMQKKNTDETWFNVYGFNLDLVYPADLVMSNFFTSKFPESYFRLNLVMARHYPNGKITLLNRQFSTTIDKTTTSTEISTHAELLSIMTEKFGIKLEKEMNFSQFFK